MKYDEVIPNNIHHEPRRDASIYSVTAPNGMNLLACKRIVETFKNADILHLCPRPDPKHRGRLIPIPGDNQTINDLVFELNAEIAQRTWLAFRCSSEHKTFYGTIEEVTYPIHMKDGSRQEYKLLVTLS